MTLSGFGAPAGSGGSGTFVGPDEHPDLYELIAHIGQGGEAQVWRAKTRPDPQSPQGITVAVKIFPAAASPAEEQEWLRRTEAMSHIANPGLARTLRVFSGAEKHLGGNARAGARFRYLVMEFVGGPSLLEWIQDNRAASLRSRLDLLATVAAALDELHASTPTSPPVAHGDIKPDNLRLTADGGIKLVDFGLMRMVGTNRAGEPMATLPYTAPELFTAGTAAMPTPESDRFSFAATVFHTITGMAPPLRPDLRGPDLARLRPLLESSPLCLDRPDVVNMVMSGLAPEPSDRPGRLGPWLQSGRASGSMSIPVGEADRATQPWQPGAQPQPAGVPAPAGSAPAGSAPAAPRGRGRLIGFSLAGLLVLGAAGGGAYALTQQNRKDDTPVAAATSSGPSISPTESTDSTQTVETTTGGATPTVSTFDGAVPSPGGAGSSPTDVTGSTGTAMPTGISTAGGIGIPTLLLADPDSEAVVTWGSWGRYSDVSINAKNYARAFVASGYTNTTTIDLDLGRSYTRLTARLGIQDDSTAGKPATVEVVGDGKVLVSKVVQLGTSYDVTVNVTGVLRLQFKAHHKDGIVKVAVGDPVVTP